MANSSLQRSRTAGSTKTKFTMSMWVKKSANNAKYLLVNYTDDSNRGLIQFGGSDEFLFQSKYSASNNATLQTNRKFRDTSGWYHFVLVGDSTLSTAADRTKLYVNGVRETSFATEVQIPLGEHYYINEATTNGFRVGEKGDGSDFFDGYISHFVFLDGVAAAYTEFGETDSTSGIWKFKSPSGLTFGTNGVHLKFENSANLGLDSSGNTNNMSVNGNLKQALDTPSNSYCTLNPLSSDSGVTLSNGNTESDYDASVGNAKGTLGFSSGKWYWEVKIATASSDYPMLGIGSLDEASMQKPTGGSYPGGFTNSYGGYGNGNVYANGSNTGSQSFAWATNDIIGIAVDLDSATKTIKWYKNGNSTAIASYNITTVAPFTVMDYNGAEGSVNLQYNFGNGFFGTTAITSAGSNGNGSLFEYDVPSGFYGLNTKNINTYG